MHFLSEAYFGVGDTVTCLSEQVVPSMCVLPHFDRAEGDFKKFTADTDIPFLPGAQKKKKKPIHDLKCTMAHEFRDQR